MAPKKKDRATALSDWDAIIDEAFELDRADPYFGQTEVTTNYDPAQERDERGRFSGGGGFTPDNAPKDEFSGSKVKQPHTELGKTESFTQPDKGGPIPESSEPQKMFPHLKHLLNGTEKVHATGLTQKAAAAKVKELRSKGVNAAMFKDPRTGKRFVVNQELTLLLTLADGRAMEVVD